MATQLGLVLLALGMSGAPAQGETEASTLPEIPDLNANTEIVCRNAGPRPGSRIGSGRICKTRGEWNRLQAERVQTQHITIHSSIRESDTPRLEGGRGQ